MALTAAAAFRPSRSLGKASVTRPLRAPFTVFHGPQGPAEPHEEAQPPKAPGTRSANS
nr:DUF1360 domain-containing protein [Streptomyces sp. Tu 3180]